VLRWFRQSPLARTLPVAMFVCLVTVSTSSLLHSDDDVLCGAVLEAHDHSAHRIGAAKSSTPEADHCFICHNHSLRSLVSTGPATSACAGEARFDVDDGSGSGVELPTSQPARAPPLV
jgi:hypothetical protein